MKTNDLIDLLAADVVPVRRHVAARRLALGLALAVPLSVLMMHTMLGVNPALGHALGLPMFWVKFGSPVLMALAALPLVARLGRPGAATRAAWAAWGSPVVALWVLGLLALARAPAPEAATLVLGRTWALCAENVALLSLPVFLVAIWTLRGLAPVCPARAGAGAGALAGACGAAVYALHCPEFTAPFVAVWYVLGMALPVAAGALLGRRLLRW